MDAGLKKKVTFTTMGCCDENARIANKTVADFVQFAMKVKPVWEYIYGDPEFRDALRMEFMCRLAEGVYASEEVGPHVDPTTPRLARNREKVIRSDVFDSLCRLVGMMNVMEKYPLELDR